MGSALFWVSLVFLVANFFLRVYYGIYGTYGKVGEGQMIPFLLGAAVYMVEPNYGLRLMKKTLDQRADGAEERIYNFNTGKYEVLTADMDPVAVAAKRDHFSGQQELHTRMIIVGTEDVPEFAIEMVLLVAKGAGDLGVFFWLSLVGTVFHTALSTYDAYISYRALEDLP